MATAKLRYPNRLSIHGILFEKDAPAPVPIPVDVARKLEDDDRFHIKFAPEDLVAAPAAVQVAEGGRPTDHGARINAIMVAIEELDAEVDENFTTDGRPDARALTSALGWQVLSAERDEAHNKMTGAGDPEKATVPRRGGVTIVRKPRPAAPPEPLDTAETAAEDAEEAVEV